MEQKNYEYLQNSLAGLGFTAILDDRLKTAMVLGNPQFDLAAKMPVTNGHMEFVFKFAQGQRRPGDESREPFYFINNVNASLTRDGLEPVQHNFMLFKQRGYDIREMKNMLEGRSVFRTFFKEGVDKRVWNRIDFTEKDKYNNNLIRPTWLNEGEFDLKRELMRPPFQGINEPDKVMLIEALNKGDRAMVSVKQANTRIYVGIEAAPNLRQLLAYDEAGNRVNLSAHKLTAVESEIKQLPQATKEILKAQEQQQSQGQEKQPGKKIA